MSLIYVQVVPDLNVKRDGTLPVLRFVMHFQPFP
jgi:hypothetical protein